MSRLIISICVLLLSFQVFAGEKRFIKNANRIPGSYIVKFQDSVTPGQARGLANALAVQHGAKLVYVFESGIPAMIVEIADEKVQGLLHHPAVEYIEEDAVVESSQLVQNSPPWHLDRHDQRYLPLNGKFYYGCPGPTASNSIAYILDTGIRADHTEFWASSADPTSRVIGGVDFVNGSWTSPAVGNSMNPCRDILGSSAEDCTGYCYGGGHGTSVASIVAGRTHGVSKLGKLVAVRTHDCGGNAALSRVIRGLQWIHEDYPGRGVAAVVNMSNSMPASLCEYLSTGQNVCTNTMEEWIAKLVNERGIAVVVAAHNMNQDAENWSPARMGNDHEGVITVGGIGSNNTSYDYRWKCNPANTFEMCTDNLGSNWGPAVDIFAPARNVPSAGIRTCDQDGKNCANSSTAPRGGHLSGTSFAAPMVTGYILGTISNSTPGTWTPVMLWNKILSDSTTGVIQQPAIPDAGPLNGSPNRLLHKPAPRCRLV